MINSKMAADLVALGLKPDDTVLVHSSLSSLGHVEGGPETVVDTLRSVLPDGTLIMPSMTCNTIGWDNMCFSIRDSVSGVGVIAEYFRNLPGVMRSMHPTHSACGIGVHAEEILSHHMEDNTPVGPHSPFSLIRKFGGKVLMLGCGLHPNTSMHGVEELSEPPYLFRPEMKEFELVDWDGTVTKKFYRTHSFRVFEYNGKQYQRARQCYDRLTDIMDIASGKVLEADAYLIDANTMWEKAHRKFLEDPIYFIDPLE